LGEKGTASRHRNSPAGVHVIDESEAALEDSMCPEY
jgi:hypothetical protein